MLFLFLSFFTKAQDLHFSQFYASPLSLNPAMTGLFPSDFRLITNFRDQWASVTYPFLTTSLSFDMQTLRGKLNKDFLGAGLFFANDGSTISTLHSTKAMFSAAYHKALDFDGAQYLALGIQAGIIQKSLGDAITLPNNWIPQTGFSPTSGFDNFQSNIAYADLQVGLIYYARLMDNKSSLYAGTALFHITKPNESLVPGLNQPLHRRFVGHAGMRLYTDQDFVIMPNFIYMFQSTASEFNIGTSVKYKLSQEANESPYLTGGLWYRWKDAIILLLGLDIQNWTAGISYDINISSLSQRSRNRGGFELSLQYIFSKPGAIQLGTNPCPTI